MNVRAKSGWLPSRALLRRWAAAALGARAPRAGISVLIVGPAASRRLNRTWRGQDHATNVLSFPAPGGSVADSLGDLVICPAVLRREAREQHKSAQAHWAHLVVHGVLHLIGYDHERDHDAQRMERREVRVLHALGIPNPYRSVREA